MLRLGADFNIANCCSLTVVSQQEWPFGISILPQSPFIWRQQAFSASESWASGMTQAIAGTPNIIRSSAPAMNLPNRII